MARFYHMLPGDEIREREDVLALSDQKILVFKNYPDIYGRILVVVAGYVVKEDTGQTHDEKQRKVSEVNPIENDGEQNRIEKSLRQHPVYGQSSCHYFFWPRDL